MLKKERLHVVAMLVVGHGRNHRHIPRPAIKPGGSFGTTGEFKLEPVVALWLEHHLQSRHRVVSLRNDLPKLRLFATGQILVDQLPTGRLEGGDLDTIPAGRQAVPGLDCKPPATDLGPGGAAGTEGRQGDLTLLDRLRVKPDHAFDGEERIPAATPEEPRQEPHTQQEHEPHHGSVSVSP